MATPTVSTPLKNRHAAAFKMPHATPPPRTPTRETLETPKDEDSLFRSNPSPRLARFKSTKSSYSPKTNIARNSPRRAELGPSEWNLSSATLKSIRPQRKITYNSADRFIPNRTASGISGGSKILANAAGAIDVEEAGLSLEGLRINDDDDNDNVPHDKPTPDEVAYQSSLASACGVDLNTRILAFKPAPPESSKPIDLRSQYNRPLKQSSNVSAQSRRRIGTAPERVLDAPGLRDDYYLNLLDWSSGNQIAIALERSVHIWYSDGVPPFELLECSPDTYITSVKWSGDGAYVSVGLDTGEVQIWDVENRSKLRSMYGHETRVGVMGWNHSILSTGARSGLVFNHDVRIKHHKVAELVSHTGEVCGLEWRADGAQLATGANDNLVNIWDARSLSAPKFTKTNHRAAVKALAWCPWQSNLLATGGGSHDRHIHFWNSTTGARTNSIDTGSQVTSLKWSTGYKELVSSSGFPDNSLSIWSWPTLVKNVEIPAHESRVLHSALSPDGQTLATAAADESLKFWKVFEKKPGSASSSRDGASSAKATMVKQMTIR